MRGFNHILSSSRITIERAFGIMTRTFGFLWSPIEYSLDRAPTMIRVCAKLHNMRVNRWISNGGSRSRGQWYEGPEPPDSIGLSSDLMPSDIEVMERIRNEYENKIIDPLFIKEHHIIRDSIAQHIWDLGLRFCQDDDFITK